MARQKRSSKILERAVRRAASMNSIDPNLNVGNGLTLSTFSTLIEKMRTYNTALSNLDKLYREMLQTERELADMAEHMLLGVATRYGKSSTEYSMAGGVPKNQRRKGLRGESPTPNSQQPAFVASEEGNGSGKKAAT
jgi:hypothetical protein